MRITAPVLLAIALLLTACGKDDDVNFNEAPTVAETASERAENVSDAFKEAPADNPASEHTTREVQAMFDKLAAAGRAYNRDAALKFVNFEAMYEVVLSDADKKSGSAVRKSYISGLETGARRGWFKESDGLFDWIDVKIMRVDTSSDGKLAVAYARHIQDEYGTLEKMRWWLVQSDAGWQLYDWEFLSTGIRASRLMRDRTASSSSNKPGLQEARMLMASGDYDKALRDLQRISARDLGTELNAVRYQYIATCQIELDKPEDALESVKAALTLKSDLPEAIYSRARAEFALKQYEDARKDFVWYIKTLGSDANALADLADCLTWLDRNDEAMATYRDSLRDYPTRQALYGLALLIDKSEATEIGEWFSKLHRQEDSYFPMVSSLYDKFEMVEVTFAINEAYRKVKPDDIDLAWYTAKVAMKQDHPQVAADALKPAIQRAPDDETQAFQNLYWAAMAKAGNADTALLEAGRSQAAFTYLAKECHDNWDADALDQLCEAYRKGNEETPDLHFYLGEADFMRDDHKAAEEHFHKGYKLAKEDHPLRAGLLHGLLDSMNHQGHGLEGYQEVGATTEAFVYLAGLLFDDAKPEALEQLLAAHTKAHADDPELVHYNGELAWLKQDWKEAAAKLSAYLNAAKRSEVAWRVIDRCVRAAVRAKDLELALSEATKATGQPDQYLLIIVHVAAEHPDLALKAVDAYLDGAQDLDDAAWWITDLYKDADIGEALKGEAYAKLHERFPIPAKEPEKETDKESEG